MAITVQVQSVIYHNDHESLMRAYESLANAVRVNRERSAEELRLIVHYGDASSAPVYSEAQLRELRSKFASSFDFQYTFFNENTGTSKGHNRVGLSCSADYIVVMNPDVIVCPRFFEKMLAPFFDAEKKAGIVEARQAPLEHAKEYDRVTLETEWATGACFMIPASLYREIGGFDEKTLFMYCDDVDISWRVRLTGRKIYYRPDCSVYHAKRLSATGNWVPTEAELYYSKEAALLMAYKWSNKKRFHKLYNLFAQGDEYGKRVIARFEQMKADNTLPEQLDPEGKVAKFVGDNYTEHRFFL
ncbi:MAG: glycosyltransferase [Clostridia bacterium]|nr:glycosyltransferase [Clostridia bacterium]